MKTLNPKTHNKQREKIQRTALHLFAVKGYMETSMTEIAKASGMQKPSLYHYFKSKQAILYELVHWRAKQIHTRITHMATGKNMEQTLYFIGMDTLADLDKKENQEFMQILYRNASNNPQLRRVFFALLKERMADCKTIFYKRVFKGIGKMTEKSSALFMHQYMGSLLRFALESKLWKAGPAMLYKDRDYVRSLAGIFAKGVKS